MYFDQHANGHLSPCFYEKGCTEVYGHRQKEGKLWLCRGMWQTGANVPSQLRSGARCVLAGAVCAPHSPFTDKWVGSGPRRPGADTAPWGTVFGLFWDPNPLRGPPRGDVRPFSCEYQGLDGPCVGEETANFACRLACRR